MAFLTFLGIVGLIFGVLQIILFFKLWGMTNNVASMLAIMRQETYKVPNKESPKEPSELSLPPNTSKNKSISFEEFKAMKAGDTYFQEYTEEYKRQLYEEYE